MQTAPSTLDDESPHAVIFRLLEGCFESASIFDHRILGCCHAFEIVASFGMSFDECL